ncbi:MAG: hypothetical protein HY040_19275 [Planctomycetes bacterium]|nr:hypothetical protein [Planctomycetota bacterium]
MLYKLGRCLQFVGLLMLPLAMAGEMTGSHDLKWMLILVTLGGLSFLLGWLLQESGKPR